MIYFLTIGKDNNISELKKYLGNNKHFFMTIRFYDVSRSFTVKAQNFLSHFSLPYDFCRSVLGYHTP